MNQKAVNVIIDVKEDKEEFFCTVSCGNTKMTFDNKTEHRKRLPYESHVWWACNVAFECYTKALKMAWDCMFEETHIDRSTVNSTDRLPLYVDITTPYCEGTKRTLMEDGFFEGQLRNERINLFAFDIHKPVYIKTVSAFQANRKTEGITR